MRQVLGSRGNASEIRNEIEKGIPPRDCVSISVQIPLSQECKRILRFASDEAAQLGHPHIETEHLLLGILMASESVAARTLTDRGVNLGAVREQFKSLPVSPKVGWRAKSSEEAKALLDAFLAGLSSNTWVALAPCFAANAQFVDSTGKRWRGYAEIEKQFEVLFVPYAKRDVTKVLESFESAAADTFLASVVWENVTVPGEAMRSMQRMTLILGIDGEDWSVFFLQVTPIKIR